MKLYINPLSPNARRTRFVARLVGAEVEEVVVALNKGEHLKPEYLAINPNHQVPALVDGELVLWESSAICVYLANRAGRTDLWPTEAAPQADVMRWVVWNHTQLSPPSSAVTWERLIKPMMGQSTDESVVEQKLTAWRTAAAVLDAALVRGDGFVACGHLTLGDVVLASSLGYAGPARLPVAEFPAIAAWLERISSLPEWKATEPQF